MTLTDFKKIQLFSTQINKLKPSWFKTWCFNFFNLYNFIIKFSSFCFITLICAVLFFVLRKNALDDYYDQPQFNLGMGMSIASNWPQWVVYFTKSIIAVIFLIFAFCFNQWYIYLCFFIVGINSLFNVIDKAMVDTYQGVEYHNTVVDYIYWGAFHFTNNVADIFIVTFIIASVIAIIAYIIINYRKDNQGNNHE